MMKVEIELDTGWVEVDVTWDEWMAMVEQFNRDGTVSYCESQNVPVKGVKMTLMDRRHSRFPFW